MADLRRDDASSSPDPAEPPAAGPGEPPSSPPAEPGARRAHLSPAMVPLRRTSERRSLRPTASPTAAPVTGEPDEDAEPPGAGPGPAGVGPPDPPAPPTTPTPAPPAPPAPPPAVPPPPSTPAPSGAARTTHAARAHRAPDPEWAATSTVLAGIGARLDHWRSGWTWGRTFRTATATLSVLVVLLCGLAWGATSWVEAAIRQIGALDPDSTSIQDAAAQQGDQNFLVVGSDTRVGAVPSEDVGDASDIPGARSDTVMVVHVPQDRSKVTIVSFPRDLEIDRPACERWNSVTGDYTGQIVPDTPRVKLNSAYQAGGPRCVTKVVQQLSGLAINHFLAIDFQGFKDMVDAVHGVSLCVESPIRDTVLGTVIDHAGTTTLTGDQALNFVRARHVVGDPTSDYGRIQRQQRFLSALLRTTLSAGTLLDVGKLTALVDAIGRSTFGENVATEQLLTLGRSLGGVGASAVSFTSVPTTGVANSRGNEVLRPVEDRALFGAIIQNQPLPGTPGAPTTPTVAPQDVTVRLLGGTTGQGDGSTSTGSEEESGSGSGGSLRTVAGELRAQGYRVVVDDAASTDETTTIRYSPDESAAAATLARSVPRAVLTPTAGAGLLALSLAPGTDTAGLVVSTTAAAAPAQTPAAPVINAADATCA